MYCVIFKRSRKSVRPIFFYKPSLVKADTKRASIRISINSIIFEFRCRYVLSRENEEKSQLFARLKLLTFMTVGILLASLLNAEIDRAPFDRQSRYVVLRENEGNFGFLPIPY